MGLVACGLKTAHNGINAPGIPGGMRQETVYVNGYTAAAVNFPTVQNLNLISCLLHFYFEG